MLEDLAEVKYVNSNSQQKPVIEWIELDGGCVSPYEKNTGTIQTTKNNNVSENRSQSSDTEEIDSTEGVASGNEPDERSGMQLSPDTGSKILISCDFFVNEWF